MVKLGALALGLLTVVAEVSAQKTVKIMPFGASIVSRCWRANLQTKLRSDGLTNFDFVGTQKSSCGGTNIDQDHEGHPGSQAVDYAAKGNLTTWLNAVDTPDIILMLLGTNDVLLGKQPVGNVLAAYDTLINQMRAKNPKIRLIFSNLLPLDPARWPKAGVDGIVTLNTAIRQYAPSKSTRDSPVTFVDNYTGFDAVADTADGEHPNDAGNEKMATKFFGPTRDAIKAVAGTADPARKGNAQADLVPASSTPAAESSSTPAAETKSTSVAAAAAQSPSSSSAGSSTRAASSTPAASTTSSSSSPSSAASTRAPTSLISSASHSATQSTPAQSSTSPTPSSQTSSASSLSGAWPVRLLSSAQRILWR